MTRTAGWAVLALLVLVAAGAPADLAQSPTPPGDSGQGDSGRGEDLFLDRCAMCHVAEGGGQGPSLAGVFGRKAASLDGFAYSAALKASGLTWTGPELGRFLADPSAAVPGTAMPIRVVDAGQRADLIAWLAAQVRPH